MAKSSWCFFLIRSVILALLQYELLSGQVGNYSADYFSNYWQATAQWAVNGRSVNIHGLYASMFKVSRGFLTEVINTCITTDQFLEENNHSAFPGDQFEWDWTTPPIFQGGKQCTFSLTTRKMSRKNPEYLELYS